MGPANFRVRGELKYKTGSAHSPLAGGHRIIMNFCDMAGTWDNLFNKDMSKKHALVEQSFKLWKQTQKLYKMGATHEVRMQSDVIILNALALNEGKLDPVAFESCLKSVAATSEDYGGSSMHMSAKNIGLSEDNKEAVEKLITECLLKKNINVTIYE